MPDPSFRLWSHTWILGRQARLQNGRHFDLANLSKDFFNVDVVVDVFIVCVGLKTST